MNISRYNLSVAVNVKVVKYSIHSMCFCKCHPAVAGDQFSSKSAALVSNAEQIVSYLRCPTKAILITNFSKQS